MLNILPFHIAVGVIYAINAVVIVTLAWMYHSPRFHAWHIRKPMPMKISTAQFYWNIIPNLALSTVVTTGAIYGLSPWTLTAAPTEWWVILLQCLGVLVVYDFSYYFMHRLFHVKRFFPWVHMVHHRVRNPRAQDSLYQSPAELIAGVGLFMLTVWVVGPIHWTGFVALFGVYSTLHIFIHSGMLFPHEVFGVKVFAPLNYLTMKHHRHHLNKHGHNFAAVTPIPDLVFGTSA